MIIIGVDPGATGALTMLSQTGKHMGTWDCPSNESGYWQLSDIISGKPTFVVIEQQQYMAKGGRMQGGKSAFSLGENFGMWKGFFLALGMDYTIVRPRDWQRYHFGSGTVISDPKERSVRRVKQLLPDLVLVPPGCKVPRHGRADAALIALYGVALLEKRGK